MNNNGMDKDDKEEKGGLTLEQFTDIVLAQVRDIVLAQVRTRSHTKIWLFKVKGQKEKKYKNKIEIVTFTF